MVDLFHQWTEEGCGTHSSAVEVTRGVKGDHNHVVLAASGYLSRGGTLQGRWTYW